MTFDTRSLLLSFVFNEPSREKEKESRVPPPPQLEPDFHARGTFLLLPQKKRKPNFRIVPFSCVRRTEKEIREKKTVKMGAEDAAVQEEEENLPPPPGHNLSLRENFPPSLSPKFQPSPLLPNCARNYWIIPPPLFSAGATASGRPLGEGGRKPS